jgi:hypothetical protein
VGFETGKIIPDPTRPRSDRIRIQMVVNISPVKTFLLASILMALCWATSWSAPRLVEVSLPATILIKGERNSLMKGIVSRDE